ncbi:hypothetical protein EDEG_03510 [Edhazardia aedis USNM 41457]|uniref:Uncharacterized protein n=1 Tax=Edhazardia aedis (strain USNM 41457) TaxID=1003232 RepID=J9D395_EDHAE|nr:hypothetical protein EDEG_03510 [Edhazardia aedis USNM 41457]|eukprot:EJW02039.1 hypothetical protein EDEG_03510 [Edhazardia aedis USNM 41457]
MLPLLYNKSYFVAGDIFFIQRLSYLCNVTLEFVNSRFSRSKIFLRRDLVAICAIILTMIIVVIRMDIYKI